MSFSTTGNNNTSLTTKRKNNVNVSSSSPVNSVISYASSSSTISGSSSNWLPPISSLLNQVYIQNDNNDYNTVAYHPSYQFNEPKEEPPLFVMPKGKKRKTQPKRQEQKPVFMPMIPYYFHHEKFGIEACMLQLEGQKKFNNYYYI